MNRLSDLALIKALQKAKRYDLDPAFIELLEQELDRRQISVVSESEY